MLDARIDGGRIGRPGEGEIRPLLDRARGGDTSAVPALREALGDSSTWRSYGDLAAHAIAARVGAIAGTDLALREALTDRLEALRRELSGPGPTSLESLLVERVLATWLEAWHADASAVATPETTTRRSDFVRKRQDSAHRRHLAAISALATVRKLLGPPDARPGVARSPKGGEDSGPAVDPGGAGVVLEFRRPGDA